MAEPSLTDFLLVAGGAVVWVAVVVVAQRLACQGCEPVAVTSASTVRVMTWNIHGGMGPDGAMTCERIVALVRRADPDVLALQEVDSAPKRRAPSIPSPCWSASLGTMASPPPRSRRQTATTVRFC